MQVGYALVNNFILLVDFGGTSIVNPDVEWLGGSGESEDTTLSISEFGGGFTYYIMPAN